MRSPESHWCVCPRISKCYPFEMRVQPHGPPNSHSATALTHTASYAGLALHPQHPHGGAITQSHLLPLRLGTEIDSKQQRQSRRRQAFQIATVQPCYPSGFSVPGRGDLEEAEPQVPVATTARCREAGIPQLAAAALFHTAAAHQPQGRIKSLSPPAAAGNAHGVSGTLG